MSIGCLYPLLMHTLLEMGHNSCITIHGYILNLPHIVQVTKSIVWMIKVDTRNIHGVMRNGSLVKIKLVMVVWFFLKYINLYFMFQGLHLIVCGNHRSIVDLKSRSILILYSDNSLLIRRFQDSHQRGKHVPCLVNYLVPSQVYHVSK